LLVLPISLPSFAGELDDDIDEIDDDNAEKCISVRTLRSTEVVDDQHILFFMSGKTVYINRLPRPCRGLSHERRFSYSTHSRNLCSFDAIRVLSDVGGSMFEGRSCRLGSFVLTSREAVDAARKRSEEPPAAIPPEGADEEEVGVEAED
jgi:hypothetical protein